MRYVVFVLGDIGRSPRMQYHTLSLSKLPNATVTLAGIKGEKCHEAITSQSNVKIHYIDESSWSWVNDYMKKSLPMYIIFAALKLLLQIIYLTTHLFDLVVRQKADYLLVQNPPALPVLPLVWFITRLRFGKCKVVVDWHNYGYTLLAMGRTGTVKRIMATVYRIIEFGFGRLGNAHLCVSNAMKQDLKKRIGIDAIVMHDCPPSIFKQINLEEKHDLFERIFKENNEFTIRENDKITLCEDRPALVISSTSWTADEDFGILLNAILELDKKLTQTNSNLKIKFVITGKGPQKEMYIEKFKTLNLQHCTIDTMFLAAEDYPKLLACGDIGVCLHYSSSGVDLPMKIVDMFGSCLPVCAVNYSTLPELVKHDRNGLIFKHDKELARDMETLLSDFPRKSRLGEMQVHLKNNFMKHRWDDEWKGVRPTFV